MINGVHLNVIQEYAMMFLRDEIKELGVTLKGKEDDNSPVTELLRKRKKELESDYKKLSE